MRRFAYLMAIALCLSGIVHILIILLAPSFATQDAWAKLQGEGGPWSFSVVARPGQRNSNNLPSIDPAFGVAACRFDLSEAPLSVETNGELPFWSVAIFDRKGRNIYSFNDRTAIDRRLFLIVVNPIQMARLRKNPSEETEKAVLIEADVAEGFVLIRAFQQDESWAPAVERFLGDAQCSRYEFPEDADGGTS